MWQERRGFPHVSLHFQTLPNCTECMWSPSPGAQPCSRTARLLGKPFSRWPVGFWGARCCAPALRVSHPGHSNHAAPAPREALEDAFPPLLPLQGSFLLLPLSQRPVLLEFRSVGSSLTRGKHSTGIMASSPGQRSLWVLRIVPWEKSQSLWRLSFLLFWFLPSDTPS